MIPSESTEKTPLENGVKEGPIHDAINELIRLSGGKVSSFTAELTKQMIQTSLKLMIEQHDIGQMKLMNRALKEMRYAYRVFSRYLDTKCISMFGSARTPEDHPDYEIAKEFSMGMAKQGWMCITGAANGIMKAGLEGAQKDASFGLSIQLPFETGTASVIEGDPKLMMFRYFFTRKLMFMSHSDAIAVFPGGFGTMDELFEVLTLLQTGKAEILPIVLLEGTSGSFWKPWLHYMENHVLACGWISPEDKHFYYLASTVEDAWSHITKFYRCYHSSRYVKDLLVIRLLNPLAPEHLKFINEKYGSLVESGEMYQGSALPEEKDHIQLPRLIFRHTKKNFGTLRALIDEINALS